MIPVMPAITLVLLFFVAVLLLGILLRIQRYQQDVKDLEAQLAICEGSLSQFRAATKTFHDLFDDHEISISKARYFAERYRDRTTPSEKLEDQYFYAGVCAVMTELDSEWATGPINQEDILEEMFNNENT